MTIYEIKFDPKFNTAILDKQVAEQNALEQKNVLKKVEYENEQKKIAAKADSAAKVIAAKADSVVIATRLKALKQQNSKEYITLQWIETWDGKLPNVVANDKVMPIVDMK